MLIIGIQNWLDCLCVADVVVRINGGMPADAQVGQHDSTAHAQGFSCQKRGADDHDII